MGKHFKIVFLFFIVTGILAQSFSSLFIVAHYEWNKKLITAKYCENKTKPKMHCNGLCHLRKQLIVQEKKEKNPASPLKDKLDTFQFFQARAVSSSLIRDFTIVKHFSVYHEGKLLELLNAVFHPPSA